MIYIRSRVVSHPSSDGHPGAPTRVSRTPFCDGAHQRAHARLCASTTEHTVWHWRTTAAGGRATLLIRGGTHTSAIYGAIWTSWYSTDAHPPTTLLCWPVHAPST
jgi:hypothetical protein